MAASLTAFGSRVADEPKGVLDDIGALRLQNDEADLRVARCEGAVGSLRDTVEDEAARATARMDELQASMAALSSWVESVRAAAGTQGSIRSIARMGNLGWDTAPETLEQRARDILQHAAIPTTAFQAVAAAVGRTGKGSAAVVSFMTGHDLECAAVAARALRYEFHAGKPVWIAPAKTRAELAPVRAMHRLVDYLADAVSADEPHAGASAASSAAGAGPHARITRDPVTRSVAVNASRVAMIMTERVVWTPLGLRMFEATTRADAEAVAVAG